jgi:two-component system, NtrC family, sensor kinase
MRFRSLRTEYMILFFVFFFVPYGLLTLFSVSMGRGMMKKSTMDHLQNLVEVKETAIEQWIEERLRDGKTMAESQEVKSLDPRRIGPFLSLAKHLNRAYQEISVLNSKGEIISGGHSKDSFLKEEWFQKGLEEGSFISTPSPQSGSKQPAMVISLAVKDGEGRSIGMLMERVNLTYVADLISESKLGETGELFIVNPQGEFLLHSRLRGIHEMTNPKVSYFQQTAFKSTHTAVYKDYTGQEVLGSWKWIPGLQGYLIAEQDTKEAFSEIDLLVKKAAFLFIVSALLILGISYWITGTMTSPINNLSKTVASCANGHFAETISTGRKDEIGDLVAGFNVMSEKLKKAYADLEGKIEASNKELEDAYRVLKQRQEQLIRSEKMAALGRLSAGIAHEIRTPLTSFKLFIQSLEKEMDFNQNQKEDFRIIGKEIDRVNENVTRFLNFARPEEPLFQTLEVGQLLKETVTLLAPRLKTTGVRLEIVMPDRLPPVEGDPKQMSQVFLNLLINALEAMPQGGTLTITSSLKINHGSSEEFLQLEIKDTGPGIPEKDRPYLFDPFFTTKVGGTGLGLSIVYSIVQKHRGRIELESEQGEGTSFILSLPIQRVET